MYRGICTVFVALAIFQGAFAIDVIKVQPRSIINLELIDQTSPSNKMFDGERASEFIGDITMGKDSEYDSKISNEFQFSNMESMMIHVEMNVTAAQKITYLKATNMAGSTVALCGNESTLGTTEVKLNARFPPYSMSVIMFTAGLQESSSTVNSIQALLIPFTLITLLVANLYL